MDPFEHISPTRVPVERWSREHGVARAEDEVAAEEPLEIRVRGRAIAVTMRSPGHDEELALGFLLTEGVVRAAADVVHVEHCGRSETGNVLNIRLAPHVHVDFDRLTRHVFTASSCGVCGSASIDALRRTHEPAGEGPTVDAPALIAMHEAARAAQAQFDRTGGVHAASACDEHGSVLVVREDVGRHNAVDKVIGWATGSGVPLGRAVLTVSGRVSFEVVQKAGAAGIPIIASVGAPSSLAVATAHAMNQTLVGFVRDGRFNVYTHARRVRMA